MTNGKYLIIRTDYDEQPILLPPSVQHNSLVPANRVISAAFWKIEDGQFICFGESTSLGLTCRGKEDEDLLNIFFNMPILGGE